MSQRWISGDSKQEINQGDLGPVNTFHPEKKKKVLYFIKYISTSIMKLLCQL